MSIVATATVRPILEDEDFQIRDDLHDWGFPCCRGGHINRLGRGGRVGDGREARGGKGHQRVKRAP